MSEGPQVVESTEQLKHLARDRALRGHTYRNFTYPGLRVERGDFAGSIFESLTVSDAELDGADLSRTTIKQVDLRRARIPGVLLARAELADCDLTEVALTDGLLEGIKLERVVMANADLSRAKLSAVRFLGCRLYGTRFSRAVVVRSTFHDPAPNGAAELTRASFAGATLIDCELGHANLYRADFTGALVVRCSFAGAILTAAQVEGARFIGCNFTGADLPDGLRSVGKSG